MSKHKNAKDATNAKPQPLEQTHLSGNAATAEQKAGEFQPHNIKKEALGPNTKR